MAISLENLEKLEDLFIFKNWEINKDSTSFSSTFNRFCNRLDLFDSEKQTLMIELGYQFLDLGYNDFQPHFSEAIKKIPGLGDYNSIIVAPLKKPSLIQTKSADALWYFLKNYSDFSYETFGSKLYFLSEWSRIKKSIANPNIILILIDDFIGTGETVVETLDELYKESYITDAQPVKVLTLAAQAQGTTFIDSLYKDMVVFSVKLDKGLTDKYTDPELSTKKQMMSEMEQKLRVESDYEFGYGRSESLFAVGRRSANNTFPVYWLEKKKKLAPFKR